jgi:endonuclease YncB( thermonuclease family)
MNDSIEEGLRLHGSETLHISKCVDGQFMLCRLIDVVDGDTIVCVIPMMGSFFKFNVRLKGIDTCEIKSKNPLLRERAVKARDYIVKRLINNNETINRRETRKHLQETVIFVYLYCYDFDKYGRLLADVYTNANRERTLSDELLQENLAYPYDGGKKVTKETDDS